MNAVTSQIFIGRHRNVLHKQPIQMAAANPYIRGNVIHIDASRIVIVDKLKRFFHIFITAFFSWISRGRRSIIAAIKESSPACILAWSLGRLPLSR